MQKKYKLHYIVEKNNFYASCGVSYKKTKRKSSEIIRIYSNVKNFELLITYTNKLIQKLNNYNINYNTLDLFNTTKINLKKLITFINGGSFESIS